MKRLTLKDVAKMAGVAPSTVSFVLNGKGKQMRIRDEVATRIMQVAEKSGYEPHRMAVNLRTGQSKTLGLIVESISGSFFASLAKTAFFVYTLRAKVNFGQKNSRKWTIRILRSGSW